MNRQENTPLFSALLEHAKKNPIQFHIPGHKKGQGMDEKFKEFIGTNALSIDLINIAPLDDLHHPHGIIKEAQELAAEAFGADYTFFSVQGTSGAIMAMIMSVVGPSDKIIVPRNVHKSILSAIIFAGATPIFIHPEMDPKVGIAHGITPKSVKKALEQHPDAKAVLVINPTYFGVAGNLEEIVRIVHEYEIAVLVDEAHGVHIHFHDQLPLSAMQAGADMAATSVHKLGGSLTQSSILNVKEGLVNPHHVQSVMSMLTTTSTSYILLASLDAARRNLAINGRMFLEQAIELSQYARRSVNEIPGLYSPGDDILGTDATYDYDPTKLLISVKDLGVTGYEVEKWLRKEYNIEVELSDLYNILCLITPGDTYQDVDLLITALQRLSKEHIHLGKQNHVEVRLPKIPSLALSPRDAFYSDTDVVLLDDSVGHVIAEFVMVYPPGIPILLPGEIITQDNIDYIKYNLAAGLPVQGPEDETIGTLKVIKARKAIPIY
ncbi:aminotransferase class I/II-fold pyridoxal phosphate-dependent enzyme [Tepidibacillus infernus]|uniref:Arginine decarboxylase n=1 Tax=Tepidibacillus decaturensis TaxID=1413211 RepID=A0A135L4L8_9BACI|nr:MULTISPECIES: aminotransferase class I/II-fold pyridoxal phosphate-dependent enzyme [Tepidibacillus]KXG43803.1 arginine decarboxylase [Tepidibacillus decaturensis]GBF11086.1 arginine decarboxylase [Tepidibacillus sp. HK-1]